jgi:hypothetical protein
VRQLAQVLLAPGAELGLERLADRTMQLRPAQRGDVPVKGFADQGMGEPVAGQDARHLFDHTRPGGVLEEVEDAVKVSAGDADERSRRELAADHGRDRQDAAAFRAEAVQSAADHLPNAVRNGEPPGIDRGRILQRLAARQQADDLAHEERVAFGLAMHRRDQRGRRREPGRTFDEACDVIDSQTSQREARAEGLAQQRDEAGREGVFRCDLGVAIRAEHEQAAVAHLARQKAQQQQRRRICPVEIVEDEQQGACRGGVLEECRQRVEKAEACLIGRQRGWGWKDPEARAHVDEHLGHRRGSLTKLGQQRSPIAGPEVRPHDLDPGPERRRPGTLEAASPQHPQAAPPSAACQLLRRARLADSGLPRQQYHSPAAAYRGLQRLAEAVHLLGTPDKGFPTRCGRLIGCGQTALGMCSPELFRQVRVRAPASLTPSQPIVERALGNAVGSSGDVC